MKKETEPKRSFYPLTVVGSQQISPSLQRITLQGDSIEHFTLENEGDYIKLLFSEDGSTDLSRLTPDQRPIMRTYTIRSFDATNNRIEIDFVRHEAEDKQCGFAVRWAMHTAIGDTISIAGPGKAQGLNLSGSWFFLAADMTALPALAAQLKRLPRDAKGYAVIEIEHVDDKQALQAPENIEISWVVKDSSTNLATSVIEKNWLGENGSVWCACEFDTMRTLREYFRNEKEIAKDNIYISSYWKRGVSEDGHKQLKQTDAQTQS
ncbi:siderophore-interacting protein [Vibrio anguillarum]|uniref:siderophore-interacting protein n=1 Tax=Vibrio anguillarum TaxID=55601 RepID=UPI002FE4B217